MESPPCRGGGTQEAWILGDEADECARTLFAEREYQDVESEFLSANESSEEDGTRFYHENLGCSTEPGVQGQGHFIHEPTIQMFSAPVSRSEARTHPESCSIDQRGREGTSSLLGAPILQAARRWFTRSTRKGAPSLQRPPVGTDNYCGSSGGKTPDPQHTVVAAAHAACMQDVETRRLDLGGSREVR